MSMTELQRFAVDFQTVSGFAERYAGLATLEELAGRMRADGYSVTDKELADAGAARGQLTDEQLDQVNGGFVLEFLVVTGLVAAGVSVVVGGAAAAGAFTLVGLMAAGVVETPDLKL